MTTGADLPADGPNRSARPWLRWSALIALLAVATALVVTFRRADTEREPVAVASSDPAPPTTPTRPEPSDSPSPSDLALVVRSDGALATRVTQNPDPLPPEWPVVRGMYSTMHSLWGERWEHLMGLIRETELNAIVIDVKDDKGQLAWHMPDVPLAVQGGGASWHPDASPRDRIMQLRRTGGYPIARVVCFKDSYIAQARPDLAVIDTRTGGPWQGRDGQYWLNPYNDEAWQYCIDVGIEAAKMGFLEVQYDYVRFPNGGDGPSEFFDFPGRPADAPREVWRHPDAITRFLASARQQLHAAGVRVSADIFGLTTYNWSWDGDGTGQVFERLAEHLDYVSPMVYPSHYGPGNYDLQPHPVDHPYETVWNAMQEAQMRSQGLRAKIRPWIEDFAPVWMGRGHSPQRVLDQKRAIYDNGVEGWMLWNASNRFSEEALEGTEESRADPGFVAPPRTRDPAAAPDAQRRRWPGYVDGLEVTPSLIGEGNSAGTFPGVPYPTAPPEDPPATEPERPPTEEPTEAGTGAP